MERRGYSRSPPRNDLPYDDLPEEDPRHREDTRRRRHGYADDRGGDDRGRRSRSRDDYRHRDEDHFRDISHGHFDDPRYDSRRHHRRGSDSYPDHERHGRPQSRRRSRTFSRSPLRYPGSPSDTVILEGLPGDISVNEVSGTGLTTMFETVSGNLSQSGHVHYCWPGELHGHLVFAP